MFKAPVLARAPTKAPSLGRKARETPPSGKACPGVTFRVPQGLQAAESGAGEDNDPRDGHKTEVQRVRGHTQGQRSLPSRGLSSIVKLGDSGWESELFWGLRFRSSSKLSLWVHLE